MSSEKHLGFNWKKDDSKKASKPLMEKRRRARMNQSLTELKALLFSNSSLHETQQRRNKLEKADILEMTVVQMKKLLHHTTPNNEASGFDAGFAVCLKEVNRFLTRSEEADPLVMTRLVQHLSLFATPPASRCPSSCDESSSTDRSLSPTGSVSFRPINDCQFENPLEPDQHIVIDEDPEIEQAGANPHSDNVHAHQNLYSDAVWRPW